MEYSREVVIVWIMIAGMLNNIFGIVWGVFFGLMI